MESCLDVQWMGNFMKWDIRYILIKENKLKNNLLTEVKQSVYNYLEDGNKF